MKKFNIHKEKFENDSLPRHTIKSPINSMSIRSFLFLVLTMQSYALL